MGHSHERRRVAPLRLPEKAAFERYFEVDAAPVIGTFDDEQLRLFYLLFNRRAFTLQGGAAVTFIESAIEEGRRYEERVAQDLSKIVFDDVFPKLARALSQNTDGSLGGDPQCLPHLPVPAPVCALRGRQGPSAGE